MSGTTFITGFPGFIAARLVEKLSAPDRRFILLVEERFAEKATKDVEVAARRLNVPIENFEIVPGDITESHLGMKDADRKRFSESVDEVFHLAAVYDLAVKQEIAFKVNVEGTKNVNSFVRSLRDLQRYNYISTCYVAGKRTGKIFETELEHHAGFRNFYEETKYLAELEVEKLKGELPLTIFRPSVVVGDSNTGETAKYDGIYYLIQYLMMAPSLLRFVNVGNNDVTLNLVPVDFVVDGIVSLSRDENALGKTIALADPAPLSTAELFDVIADAMTGKKSVFTPPTALVEFGLHLPFSPPLTGLPHSGVPYFFLSQSYDTSVGEELLASRGVRCPSFTEYAASLIEFVIKHPNL